MRILISAALLAVLSACSTTSTNTQVTSVRASHAPAAPYTTILVVGEGGSLGARETAERDLGAALAKRGVRAIMSAQGSASDSPDFYAIAERGGADAILFFTVTEEGVAAYDAPLLYVPGFPAPIVIPSVLGQTSLTSYVPTGSFQGGEERSYPRAAYEAALYGSDRRQIWTAQVAVVGNMVTPMSDLASSAAESAIDQLAKDQLIAGAPQS